MNSIKSRIEYWNQKLEMWPYLKSAKPNDVHKAIVELEKAGKVIMVVTQNTDGLHTIAGLPKNKIIELHGNTRFVECQICHFKDEIDKYFIEFSRTGDPPDCPECGGPLKPATISFGQNLRSEDIEKAFSVANNCDLVIALGSTLSVMPASLIPLEAVKRRVPYIIINMGPTEHDENPNVTLRIEGNVVDIFPQIVNKALYK